MNKRSMGVVAVAAAVAVAMVPVLAFGAAGLSANDPVRVNGWVREAVLPASELGKTQAKLGKLEIPPRAERVPELVGEVAALVQEDGGAEVAVDIAEWSGELQTAAPTAACPGFEDVDGDGVCDHWEEGACPSEHWFGGQGGYGCSGGYADVDNDGVCDRWEEGVCPGSGYGNGRGHGSRVDDSGARASSGWSAGHGHGSGHHGRCL